ncbi:class I SAM-dependent methyltransferase [Ruminiclostridium josui]|uniref:class I SAM-dependent methyltransferase n=1 Tax=Ruminiclostridium josui TaxID=1499 RepID=UPI000467041F|nr:class I SAM-dependent methyltransferase [Ruminiclostridium josui]
MINSNQERHSYIFLCFLDYLFSKNIIDKQDFIDFCESYDIRNYEKIFSRDEAASRSSNHEMHPGGAEATLRLAEMAGITKDMSVLDAGSGHGGAARILAEKYTETMITGIDNDPIRVIDAIFRSKDEIYKNLKFTQGNAYKMTFQDNYFDVIIRQHAVYGGLEEDFLSECNRVLKSKGKIAFQGTLCSKKLKATKTEMADYSYEEYCNLLTRHGFRIIETEIEKASSQLLSSISDHSSSYYFLVKNGIIIGADIVAEKID